MLLFILALACGEILFPITIESSSKVLTLPNGLEITLVSCDACSESGVAMGIKIGSLFDPIPGLAHFLEHMLFYASETYPQEDYLTSYIGSHGGSSNAFTGYTSSVYFYSISNAALQESLHIFSRTFAEPIFLNETASREMLAVNSEMHRDKYDNIWREQRLMELVLGKPFDKVSVGDLSSLSVPNITDELYAFWRKYYRASNMKLAVCGNYSLETMEGWVREMYGDIEEGGEVAELEQGDARGNFAETELLDSGKSVVMLWKLYPEDIWPRVSDFIGYLVSYSLERVLEMSYSNVYVGAGIYDDVGIYSIFTLGVYVGDSSASTEGLCSAALAAINSISSLDNSTLFALWEDYRMLYYYDFYYSDPVSADDMAIALAYNMLYFEEEYYFAGDYIVPSYSFDNIQETLVLLSGERSMTVVLSDSPQFESNSYEETFEMQYYIANWTVVPNEMLFVQLEKNPHMPDDLQLIRGNYSDDIQLIEDSDFRVWFKYNYDIKKPVVMISALITPEYWGQYKVLGMVHCSIVLEMAFDQLTYWFLAGYSLEIESESPGIAIKVYGWNQGILEFFEEVLKLFTTPDISRFSAIHEAALTTLLSYNDQVSYLKAIEYLNRLVTPYTTMYQEQYALLLSYTLSNYLNFLEVLPNCSIDTLILGNLDPPNVFSGTLSKYFTRTPTGKYYKSSLDISGYSIFTAPGNNENAIINWYDFGRYEPLTFAAIQLFRILTSDKAFIALRSQAQLGYTVSLDVFSGWRTNVVYLIVQGSYYNPAEMQEFINSFWTSVSFSEGDIDEAKETFRSMSSEPNNYEDLQEGVWFEIETGRLQFEDRENILEALDNVELEHVLGILRGIQEHENEVSIRIYVDMTQSTENSISLDYFRQQISHN